jgi:1,4-alpha-glucan branching enzyme
MEKLPGDELQSEIVLSGDELNGAVLIDALYGFDTFQFDALHMDGTEVAAVTDTVFDRGEFALRTTTEDSGGRQHLWIAEPTEEAPVLHVPDFQTEAETTDEL